MLTVSAGVIVNRRRWNYPNKLSAGVIVSPRRNNYPPGGEHPKSFKNIFFETHSTENGPDSLS